MFDSQLQSEDGSDTQAGQAWPSTGQMLTISLACHGEGAVAAALETEIAPTATAMTSPPGFTPFAGEPVEVNRSRPGARTP